MALADDFRRITSDLPEDWEVARLRLTMEDEREAGRAVSVLGPTNPGRHGKLIQFQAARRGAGFSLERVGALLGRLDRERIHGVLELVDVLGADPAAPDERLSLASAWSAAVSALPSDWSHAVGEVSLTSTDYIEPGALRLSPLNPLRLDHRPIFRFRVARTAGYGTSAEMAHRCFERLDEGGIRGSVRILNAVSDVHLAKTQGPVWYEGGRVV